MSLFHRRPPRDLDEADNWARSSYRDSSKEKRGCAYIFETLESMSPLPDTVKTCDMLDTALRFSRDPNAKARATAILSHILESETPLDITARKKVFDLAMQHADTNAQTQVIAFYINDLEKNAEANPFDAARAILDTIKKYPDRCAEASAVLNRILLKNVKILGATFTLATQTLQTAEDALHHTLNAETAEGTLQVIAEYKGILAQHLTQNQVGKPTSVLSEWHARVKQAAQELLEKAGNDPTLHQDETLYFKVPDAVEKELVLLITEVKECREAQSLDKPRMQRITARVYEASETGEITNSPEVSGIGTLVCKRPVPSGMAVLMASAESAQRFPG